MKRIYVSFLLMLYMAFSIIGCGVGDSNDLMTKVEVESPDVIDISDENVIISDFAVRLFQHSLDNKENTLISPVSILSALAIVANGADSNTLIQMEEVIGMSIEDLNDYMYTYNQHLSEISDKKNKLHFANSIWLKDDDKLVVEEDFLQVNSTYHDTSVYKVIFDDMAVQDMNRWVEKKTDGMIQEVLDEISEDTVMYLINVLAFDGKWQEPYKMDQVRNDYFTSIDGQSKLVDTMFSTENQYLEDDDAVGFIKYYKDNKYAFVGLLPNENVDITKYIENLTGEHLQDMLSNSIAIDVYTSMPKFTSKYDIEMSTVLTEMGISDAFEQSDADFSRLGFYDQSESNIHVDQIIHKTSIEVNESGTIATAATEVETGVIESSPEYKVVYLNRPFIYILMDQENKIPLFIGTVMDIKE